MVRVVFKRRHNGRRSYSPTLRWPPRSGYEFMTYEHSVERWYA